MGLVPRCNHYRPLFTHIHQSSRPLAHTPARTNLLTGKVILPIHRIPQRILDAQPHAFVRIVRLRRLRMPPHTILPLVQMQHLVDHQIILETGEPSIIRAVEPVFRPQQGHAIPARGRVGELDLVRLPGRRADVDEPRVELGEGRGLRMGVAGPVGGFVLPLGRGAVEVRGPVLLSGEGRV